ncbi:unnamed protein product [Alternaria alternata]
MSKPRPIIFNLKDSAEYTELNVNELWESEKASKSIAPVPDPVLVDEYASDDMPMAKGIPRVESIEKDEWLRERLKTIDISVQDVMQRLEKIEMRLNGIERSANRSDILAAEIDGLQGSVSAIRAEVGAAQNKNGILPELANRSPPPEVVEEEVGQSSSAVALSVCPSCLNLPTDLTVINLDCEKATAHQCALCETLLDIVNHYMSIMFRPEVEIEHIEVMVKDKSLDFGYGSKPDEWVYGFAYLDVFSSNGKVYFWKT